MSRRFLTPPRLPSGTSLPSAGAAGDLFFKSDESKIYVHDGTTWVIAQGSGGSGGGVIVSATAPSDPDEGTYWFDSTTAKSYIFYDSFWVEVGDNSGGYIVSETAPSNPTVGDVWFSTSEGVIYVYYDGFWVDPSTGGAAGVPVGGTTGQVLAKNSSTDYDTEWIDISTDLAGLTDVSIQLPLQNGDTLIYNSTTGLWENGVGGSVTTVSETAPTAAETGDTWFKSSTGQHFIYYDSYWVELGVGPQGPEGPEGPAGRYTASATAPSSPVAGDAWFDTTDGRTYVYYDSYWVEVGAAVAGKSAYEIAVDNGFVGTEAEWVASMDPAIAVAAVIDSAPASLNTLNELAAALNDDANFATTVTNALATKASTGKAIAMAIVFGG